MPRCNPGKRKPQPHHCGNLKTPITFVILKFIVLYTSSLHYCLLLYIIQYDVLRTHFSSYAWTAFLFASLRRIQVHRGSLFAYCNSYVFPFGELVSLNATLNQRKSNIFFFAIQLLTVISLFTHIRWRKIDWISRQFLWTQKISPLYCLVPYKVW